MIVHGGFMRQPYQVLVLPYKFDKTVIKYCVFRTKKNFWQFVSGGGENEETIWQTAARELFEETKIKANSSLDKLESVCSIPVSAFSPTVVDAWGDIYVVPEYSFSINISQDNIILSHEHDEFVEVTFEEANSILKYDSNKTALFELNQKLKHQLNRKRRKYYE